jgi:uncharacterized membrane protein YczE
MVAFGISLSVIANVGIASINAFASTMSEITSLKIGFFIIIINTSFTCLYFVLTRFKYVMVTITQLVSINILGIAVNFFVYDVFGSFVISSYLSNVFILSLGIVITAISLSIVNILHIITFSIESVCYTLEKMHIISFFKARVSIDIFFITVSIVLHLIFETTLYIREGTFIAMILFSFMMKHTLKLLERIPFIQKNA